MIWLTWRQHRKQALFALIGLALLGAVFIPSGITIHRSFVDTGLGACLRGLGITEFVPFDAADACDGPLETFKNAHSGWEIYGTLLVVLPCLVGLFWGAPLVAREVEQGTHHLVWTQGVTRRRWALIKFGLVGGAVVAAAALYVVLMNWWTEPLTKATGGEFGFIVFDLHGIVPIGYTVFAVALGIFAGALTRKVLLAMATTLVCFIGFRALVMLVVRPNFLVPLERRFPVATTVVPNQTAGDWILSHALYNEDGSLKYANGYSFCRPSVRCPDEGTYNLVVYQPGGRFWLFQYLETGIYVAVAALLLYLALRLVRRSIA